MKFKDYPRTEIEAALAAKGLNHRKLAVRLKKSNSVIHRIICKKSVLPCAKLEDNILRELMPELELIHEALEKVV